MEEKVETILKASELRIGNYINNEETTHIVFSACETTVKSHWVKDIEKKELYKTPIGQIKPIPLTEEWLIKFGYELQPSKTYLSPNSGNFIWFENELKDCSIAGEYYMQHIKFVHQLQNLFFALTEKELTIKE